VLKLLLSAVCNPWLLALCVMGVLLASASNTYVFFLPMIINALLQGEHSTQGLGLMWRLRKEAAWLLGALWVLSHPGPKPSLGAYSRWAIQS
jgi:hypothetical protein